MTTHPLAPGFAAVTLLAAVAAGEQRRPVDAVDELLAADRRHAGAAASVNVTEALAAMFDRDVVLSAMGAFHVGRDVAVAHLRSMPENATARLEWAPVRGAVSADGTHGFTFGFMTLVRADSSRLPLKYLAYWIKGADGWKVRVFRRVPRPAGDVALEMRAPLAPARMVPPDTGSATIARYAREIGDAERAFSALAGRIGLGPAFARNAASDAMNMGGPRSADFVYGPEAIGAAVGAGEQGPSTLTWGPDTVLVASSGDLGVTIGYINIPAQAQAPASRVPFFTVWRKIDGVWKFVAE